MTPIVFHGKAALDVLWSEAQRYHAYEEARRQMAQTLNPPTEYGQDHAMEGIESTAVTTNVEFATDRINAPQLGLESWLLKEMQQVDGEIQRVAIEGQAALDLSDIWANHNTL